jgi:predicted 3-demethylubiquinone-9 3-methyltransferase (glyoxalase superfamily)
MELLSDPDPGRAQRATEAMLQMRKIDVATLQAAADAAQGKN